MSARDAMISGEGMLAPRGLFFFEKWYFDAQSADGSFALAYFAPMALLGKRSAELVVCLFPPGEEGRRQSVHLKAGDFSLDEGRARASFSGGELALSPEECTFTCSREGVEVELGYRPMDPPWVPGGGGRLLEQKARALRWVVPVPRARVEGRVKVGDRERSFSGFGYSDFVQTDIPPWRLPLRELLWGRALGPDTLVVWDRASFAGAGDKHVAHALVSLDGEERRALRSFTPELGGWVEHPGTGGRFPSEVWLDLDGARGAEGGVTDRLQLGTTRLLLGEHVADVQRFRSGFERWLYRSFTGNPVEYKLLSEVGAGGAPRDALAAHEWVLWGRGRDRGQVSTFDT